MSERKKLTTDQLQLFRLIRDSKTLANGSYRVSNVVWPLLDGAFPTELVELQKDDNGGVLRLTALGQAVSDYSIGPRS